MDETDPFEPAASETDACLSQAAARLSADSLNKVWDNLDDSDYDCL